MRTSPGSTRIIELTLVICLLIGFSGSVAMAQNSGDSASDFELMDVHGELKSLAEFRGQVVILNFWASYCAPCRQEKPSMENLYQEQQGQGLVILAVTGEKPKAVNKYLKKNPLSFHVLLDGAQAVHRQYAVMNYPQSFVIDRNGTLVERLYGPQNWAAGPVHQLISRLLE